MWFVYALGSAVFAALTSILAKIGIEGVNSTLATAIRTAVVLLMSWGMVFLTGTQAGIAEISRRSWLFLVLSGLATGASWLCYYHALQVGAASKVVPIDKLSVVITLALAFVVLHEPLPPKASSAAPSSPPAHCLWCCNGQGCTPGVFMGKNALQKPFQLDAVILLKILQPLGKALCARGGVGVVLAAFYAVHHPHAAALREHLGQIAGGFVRKGLEPDAHFRVQLCHGALPLCAAAAGFYGGVRLLIQLVINVALAQQFGLELHIVGHG